MSIYRILVFSIILLTSNLLADELKIKELEKRLDALERLGMIHQDIIGILIKEGKNTQKKLEEEK